MKKTGPFVCLTLFVLVRASASTIDVKKLTCVREFKEALAPFNDISVSDILITPKALYVAIHQDVNGHGHNILVLDKSGRFLYKIGQRMGRGPDELEAPQEIAIWANEIMVNDIIGISFYSLDGGFLRRFNPFTLEISCTYVADKFYMTAANPNTETLFEAYSPEGKYLFDFGKKFKKIDDSFIKRLSVYAVFFPFMGKLLTDGSTLYFVNSTFGKALAFNLDGTEKASFDITSLFGSLGAETADFMERWWVKKEFAKEEIQTKEMFIDAELSADRIYILYQLRISLDDYLQGKRVGTEIMALDKDSFKPIEVYTVPVTTRRMAVETIDNEPFFYFFVGQTGEAPRISVFRKER